LARGWTAALEAIALMTLGIPKPTPRRKRRGHRDPVTTELRAEVFERDGFRCVASLLALRHGEPIDECRGQYGQRAMLGTYDGASLYDLSALTFEHVHMQPMTGRRAPSDKEHGLTLCWHHNVNGWASSHKEWERQYLRSLYGDIAA
jgi:hypothetical protein